MRKTRIFAFLLALAFLPACGFSPTGPDQQDAGVMISAPDGTVAAGGFIGPDS